MIVKVVTIRTTQRPPSSLHDLNFDNDIISCGQHFEGRNSLSGVELLCIAY